MWVEFVTHRIGNLFCGKMVITLSFLFVGLISPYLATAVLNESCSSCQCEDTLMICKNIRLSPCFSSETEFIIIVDVKSPKFLTQTLNLPSVIDFRALRNTFSEIVDQTFSVMSKLELVEILESRVQNLSPAMFENNTKITTVRFSNNFITEIPLSLFRNLRSLKKVDFKGNKINAIRSGMFIKNDRLMKIDLSGNCIDRLEAGAFNVPSPSVIHLNISWNLLRELPESVFSPCSGLKILDVSHNRIETVHPKAFEGLSSLEELFLQGNNLQTVDGVCSETLGALRVLNLQMNPLATCGCNDGAILSCKQLCKEVFLSGTDCNISQGVNCSMECTPETNETLAVERCTTLSSDLSTLYNNGESIPEELEQSLISLDRTTVCGVPSLATRIETWWHSESYGMLAVFFVCAHVLVFTEKVCLI